MQQAEILQHQAEIKREKTQKNAVLIVGILFIILAFLIYRMYKFKVKTNIKLEKQKAKLEELVATKNKFFSILSHDLRNPFGVLVSVSGLLKQDFSILDRHQKESMIKTINQSAVITNNLLEDILKWATTQTGNLDFNPKPLDLMNIVNEVGKIYYTEAKNKQLTFNLICDYSVIVYADKNMIETILRNLISNAIKFTPEKGVVKIILNSSKETANIKVIDSGIGIEKHYLNKLFKIDTNHRNIGNSKNKGTGLGLILCKEFSDINKGELKVQSEIGQGSTFIFSLPLYNKK